MGNDKIPYRGEIDWVNERVAKATGMSLKFLYEGDGIHPSTRALQMNLDEFTKMQRGNDSPPTCTTVTCSTCRQDVVREPQRQAYSISQQMAMSEAWSHELRYKIQQAKEKHERPAIRVDAYFEDWE